MAIGSDERDNNHESPETPGLGSLLPFLIKSNAQRLTIPEAITEGVYREPMQIDIQWGDGKKYNLDRFTRQNCVRTPADSSPSDTDPDLGH